MCVLLPSGFMLVFFCARSTFFLAVAPDKVLPPPLTRASARLAARLRALQRCQTACVCVCVGYSWQHSAASLRYLFFCVSCRVLCCFLVGLLLWLLLPRLLPSPLARELSLVAMFQKFKEALSSFRPALGVSFRLRLPNASYSYCLLPPPSFLPAFSPSSSSSCHFVSSLDWPYSLPAG